MVVRYFLILFLTLVSAFAQRTPLSVNGVIVNNPNLTNTPTLTWAVVGANISATAGDTIWTNDGGNITLVGGTNQFVIYPNGSLTLGTNILTTYGENPLNVIEALRFTGDGEPQSTGLFLENADSDVFISDAWLKVYPTTHGTTNATSALELHGITGFGDSEIVLTANSSSSSQVQFRGLFNSVGFYLEPTAPDGTVPYRYDTSEVHSSGDIFSLRNKGTNQFAINAASGWTGSGTLFLGDDGKVHAVTSPPGTVVTNIIINPTDLFYAYRSGPTNLADGTLIKSGTNLLNTGKTYGMAPIYSGRNATSYVGSLLPTAAWPGFMSVSDFSVDGFGKGKLSINSTDSSSGNGVSSLDYTATTTASATNGIFKLLSYRSAGSVSSEWDIATDPYTAANNYLKFLSNNTTTFQLSGAGVITFGPGTTNTLYRSGSDLVYTNGLTSSGPTFKVVDGSANEAKFSVKSAQAVIEGSSGVDLNAGPSSTVRFDGTSWSDPGGNNAKDLGNGSHQWRTLYIGTHVTWNGTTNTVFDLAGAGSPEGVVTAGVGSTYRRYDGGAGTSFYVKEPGSSNTGWVGK